MTANEGWYGVEGATAEDLADLRAASPVELPPSYFALLEHSDGGEGPIEPQPYYFQLNSAKETAEAIRWQAHGPEFVSFLIIGSNGGGEFIAFDLRNSAPWPIVFIDMVAGTETARLIAADFDAFRRLLGTGQPEWPPGHSKPHP